MTPIPGPTSGYESDKARLELAPIGSRWFAWGMHQTVLEHSDDGSEIRVRLQADGRKPDPCTTALAGLLAHGVPSEGQRSDEPAAQRRENSMARKAAGPKETEARQQREAKAEKPAADDKPAAEKKTAAKKSTSGVSAAEAIVAVLTDAGGEMPVPEIIEKAVPKATALKGANPKQTMYSVLYSEAKRKSPRFTQVGKGTFKIAA